MSNEPGPRRGSGQPSARGTRRRRPDAAAQTPAQPARVPRDAEALDRLTALDARLDTVMIRDAQRLRRRLDGLRRGHGPLDLSGLTAEIDTAAVRRARRTPPPVTYPAELPVSQRKDDIAAAIRDHQVVIVAGETGSGKTTQLPKICLELGRGVAGLIGHTQPRRIAARTVSDRIAQELGTELGTTVGFKVRFTDQVSDSTLVKVMTDGILLAELQNDRLLHQYDTIIIDEAHERSLNIDFLLGCLKQILPRRPDLKLVITSATIDPERFAQHFAGPDGTPAPIIEVSGRTYPVEVRYRPLLLESDDADDDEIRDQPQAICDAVTELAAEGPGDILIFCSGEREIRDTAEALAGMNLRMTEILPLYARLSVAEQHRVFAPHTGRRIVLATNVAETSLTVPGIKYVIDPGTARISRYSQRLKVQRLPIEPVSQASANQRKGRCGRTSDGICVRLYSEEDFLARPEFTEPEILRTNLAGVILQMTAYNIGDIATFPFVEPPDRRNIADGFALLQELGAFGERKELTGLGRKLAALPVDPRMARMVLEADRNLVVREVMVIAAALSIVDPRERPTDRQEQAQQKHARFAHPDSDFLALLNLWNYLQQQQKELSGNQFRRLCRTDFLNYLRVREWQDIFQQLRQAAKQLGVTTPPAPEPDADGALPAPDADKIHQSLLAGLLSHIGLKDVEATKDKGRNRFEYLGARGAKFAIAPGSALFKSVPRFVVAAELVETSRLWGRVAAKVEPEWAERLGAHLVKRSYSEPHWSKKQASVIAYEKVMLYGVPLVAQRTVQFGRIDPVVSRELFIRHALVEGDWDTRHDFFHENRALLDEVEELEHRARRRDIMVADEDLYAFYDGRIPADVVSGRHFDTWWKQARRDRPDLLSFEKSMLINAGVRAVSKADYPDSVTVDGVPVPLTYQFEPGADADGVTAHVPLPALATLRGDAFDWQIPGLRHDLVTALIKALPKNKRVSLVPAPDNATTVLGRLGADPDEPILPALEREFRRMTGVLIARADWDLSRVPEHLKMTYRIVGEKGEALAEGKDLEALRAELRVQARAAVAAVADGLEQAGLTSWPATGRPDNALPAALERRRGGYVVTAYPALADEGTTVALRVYEEPRAAATAMTAGLRRLLLLSVSPPVPLVSKRLSNDVKLTLMRNPSGNVGQLMADCVDAAVDSLAASFGGPVRDEPAFLRLRDHVRAELHDTLYDVVMRVRTALAAWHTVSAKLDTAPPGPAIADIRAQLAALVHPGFVTATGADRLVDVARYLRAIEKRLERLATDARRDAQQMEIIDTVQAEYADWLTELPAGAAAWPEVRAVRAMIEELRVNLFAQAIGTPYPVSEKRIYKAMDEVT